MSEHGTGLRARKRQRTYRAISDAAVSLFLERGFDTVSVSEIAEAAEVSKPTLFRYFRTKEDMALHRFADHEDEAARVVAGRPARESPLTALENHFLAGLEARDPVTGLCDEPEVLSFHRLLYGTPELVARLHSYTARSEEALADALAAGPAGGAAETGAPETGTAETGAAPGLTARLAAGQLVTSQRVLATANWRRIADGARADSVSGAARQDARRAFALLRTGLTPFA
ncbi:TetR/AcrR family transcriptional regulator [Streptomyces qinglanensis]|uniref:DNA-binding transcriptional regulator, AcrR family n=1 Tax=Streptomyces qinglanensis TaxID=943816 RepID=A0A1H9TK41_9ACTN|nr:TetR family transcriptional regulator [Streptomyces qinglanensis]SER97478.1 DNA-binding transcriptional regulator, AcrR family [Streptomyces qinglanensis]